VNLSDIDQSEVNIWKGQTITINVLSTLMSSATPNEVISNPMSIKFSTENPDVTWTYSNMHVKKSYEQDCTNAWAWSEVFMHRSGLPCHADINNNGLPMNTGLETGWCQTTGVSCIRTDVYDGWDITPQVPPNCDHATDCGTSWPWHVACQHCGDDQFFATAIVAFAGETHPGTFCSTDHADKIESNWRLKCPDQRIFNSGVLLNIGSQTDGTRYPFFASDFGVESFIHYNGVVRFTPTPAIPNGNHWLDYWGAAAKYAKSQDNGNFRADLSVEIK
jgi:hypothetical protein